MRCWAFLVVHVLKISVGPYQDSINTGTRLQVLRGLHVHAINCMLRCTRILQTRMLRKRPIESIPGVLIH